jgi:hypothetical protein
MPSIKIIDLKTINHLKHSFSLINQKAIIMKKMLLIFGLALISLVSCKKDKPVVLSAFDKVSYTDIQAKVASMTTGKILVTTTIADDLKPGAIVIYTTTGGSLGKLILRQSVFNEKSHRFIFDMVNYDGTGKIILSKTQIMVSNLEMVDLDSGEITTADGAQSFIYYIDAGEYFLSPDGLGLAKFYVYSN